MNEGGIMILESKGEQALRKIPTGAMREPKVYGICYRFDFWDEGHYAYLLYGAEPKRDDRIKRWQDHSGAELYPFELDLPAAESLK